MKHTERRIGTIFAILFLLLCGTFFLTVPCMAKNHPIRYLMVGDSYSDHNFCGSGPLWQEYVSSGLKLSKTVYVQKGGCGFAKTTDHGAYQFLTILKARAKKIDRKSITHILVGGGIGNDYTYKKGGATSREICSAMQTFDRYARSAFPNLVTIEYAGINWGISGPRCSYSKARCPIYYHEAKRLGWQPLYGSENGLRKDSYRTYFYFHKDGIHPKDPGERLIANAIMKSMITYSARTGVKAASYLKVPKPASYSITYRLGGGKVSGNPMSYKQGFVTAWTLKNPTRNGFSFAGWKGSGLKGTVKTVTVRPGRTGNLTYTAIWVKNRVSVEQSRRTVLRAWMKKTTKTSITLSWNRISGIDGYMIYSAVGSGAMKKITKTGSGNDTWTCQGLKTGTYYKFCIVAVDHNDSPIYRSEKIYITTSGGKYTNPTGVRLNETQTVLKKGRTFSLRSTVQTSGGVVKKFTDLAYLTDNPNIATVSSRGVITARGKGYCYVYAITQSGCWNRIRVTVR